MNRREDEFNSFFERNPLGLVLSLVIGGIKEKGKGKKEKVFRR